jgi:uncharacterized membrane protein YhdT
MGKETRRTREARRERAMRTASATLLSLIITASWALAAGGEAKGEGLSMFGSLFIAFAILIVLFQFVPGIMLLLGMLKGIFSASEKKPNETTANK